MTVDSWLQAAIADAERRGLPDLKPLLEALARATKLLRAADWIEDATGRGTDPGRSEDRPFFYDYHRHAHYRSTPAAASASTSSPQSR